MAIPSVLVIGNALRDCQVVTNEIDLHKAGLKIGDVKWANNRGEIESILACIKQTAPHWSLGGSGANVAKWLADALPKGSVALCGKRGPDDEGRAIEVLLNKIGIRSLLTEGKNRTGIANCFTTPNQRTMLTYLGACNDLTVEDIKPEYVRAARHVHFEGYAACFQETLSKGILRVKEINQEQQTPITISVDLAGVSVINTFKDQFDLCKKNVDIIFGNLEEFKALTGCSTAVDAIAKFNAEQTVVITNAGEKGWIKWKGETQVREFTPLAVDNVVDPTGAGDAFTALFLYGILLGKSPTTCAALGSLAASFVIQQRGTDLPDNEWERLGSLIKML